MHYLAYSILIPGLEYQVVELKLGDLNPTLYESFLEYKHLTWHLLVRLCTHTFEGETRKEAVDHHAVILRAERLAEFFYQRFLRAVTVEYQVKT